MLLKRSSRTTAAAQGVLGQAALPGSATRTSYVQMCSCLLELPQSSHGFGACFDSMPVAEFCVPPLPAVRGRIGVSVQTCGKAGRRPLGLAPLGSLPFSRHLSSAFQRSPQSGLLSSGLNLIVNNPQDPSLDLDALTSSLLSWFAPSFHGQAPGTWGLLCGSWPLLRRS